MEKMEEISGRDHWGGITVTGQTDMQYMPCVQCWPTQKNYNMDENIKQLQMLPNKQDLSHTTSSPPWNLEEDRVHKHIRGKAQAHHSHRQEKEKTHIGERDKRRGWISWRTKIQIQNIGNEARQSGERDGSAQRSLSKKRGQGGETRERDRAREIDTAVPVGQQANSEVQRFSESLQYSHQQDKRGK